MLTMNYMIAKIDPKKGECRLGPLWNVPRDHQIRFGVSRAANFPSDAEFRMDEDFPKDLTLADVLESDTRALVASARLRELLEGIPGALFQNEILPVKIINHKGRAERSPYFIISQLDHPPCLDENQSVGRRSPINPEHFQSMKKMVLDEIRIDPKLMLFRVAQFPIVPIMRRDLALKLRAERLTGISFHEIEGYRFL